MRFKTNLGIGALFVALAAFVYLYEIKGEEERRVEAQRSSKLLEFSEHEVQRISVQRAGTGTTIERRADEWWITEPLETQADEDAVERYLRNIDETEAERVIEDSSAAAGSGSTELELRYGLAEPRLSLFMELSEGDLDTVRFGSDSPTERFAYAQRRGANREVVTVRAWRFDNLDKDLFDLRDKRLLAFDKSAVREISLFGDQIGIGLIRITRAEDDGWRIESPVRAKADKNEVDGMLNKLVNSTVESFTIEAPASTDLEEVGLSPNPLLEVALSIGEDRAVKTLSIGNPKSDGDFYARDASRAPVFLIDSTVVAALSKSLFTWRDKSLLSIDDYEQVTRLELLRADQEQVFVVERDSSGAWVIVAPQQRAAKSWKVNGILTDLEEIQVVEFIIDTPGEVPELAPFGLNAPRVRLLMNRRDGTEVELVLGAETDGGVYATIAGSHGVCVVGADVLKSLDLQLDDIASPAPAMTDSTDEGADSADAREGSG